jgi:hypothetical protein
VAKRLSRSSTRDNFTMRVKATLARRAGYLCSRPSCRAITVGPSRESLEAVATVGVAAHISAAASGGPRFVEMPPRQRSSASNGIWLCATDATLIDRDEVQYTIDVLQRWKAIHEAYVEANIGHVRVQRAEVKIAGRVISHEAARIAVERLPGWQIRLFAQLLRDEISAAEHRARDLRLGLVLSGIRAVEPEQLFTLKNSSLSDVEALADAAPTLLGTGFAEAVAANNGAGDLEALGYVAIRLGDVYRAILDWSLEWVATRCSWPEARRLIELMPRVMEDGLNQIASYPSIVDAALDAAIVEGPIARPREVVLRMTISPTVTDAIRAEIRRLVELRPDLAGNARA